MGRGEGEGGCKGNGWVEGRGREGAKEMDGYVGNKCTDFNKTTKLVR